MKSYYFRNILNQIVKLKKDSFIIFVFVFLLTFFLSQVYFFGYNSTIEKNVANHLNLSQEIMNNHIFSNNSNVETSKIRDFNLLFNDVIDMIHDIGHFEYVDSYDYNLVIDRECYLDNPKKMSFSQWFGINQETYLNKNRIKLVEGRMMTQQEIDEGKPVIVVADNTMLQGENRHVQVGDIVTYKELEIIPDGTKPIELEVIGVYKNEFKHFQTYGVNDEFVNSGASLVSNQLILNIIKENKRYDYSQMKINRIIFYIDDYQHDYAFKAYLLDQLKEFENQSKEQYGVKLTFQLMPSKNSSIINSVVQIKNVYQIVFAVIISVVTLLFISVIHYMIKKKTQEIKIYYALGQTKTKIIYQYICIYSIIGIVAILLALIVGYFISQWLLSSMITDKIAIQSELLRFSEEYSWTISNEQLLTPDYHFNIISSIQIIIEVMVLIVITISISMMSIFKEIIMKDRGMRKWKKS